MSLSDIKDIVTSWADCYKNSTNFNISLWLYNQYSTSSFNFKFQINTSNLKLQLQNLTSHLNFKCQPHTLDSESTSNVNFKSQPAPNFKFKPKRQLQRSFSKSTFTQKFNKDKLQLQSQTLMSNIKLWQSFTSQCLEVNKYIIKYKVHGLLGFYT